MKVKPASKRGRGSRAPEPAAAPVTEPRPHPPRVLLCERDPEGATSIGLALRSAGIEPLSCANPKSLLDEAARQPADAVICELAVGCREDIFMLELLRRVAPSVPLILIASEGSLATQRLVLGLRPMYYAVGPVEGPELREAVEAALARRNRSTGAAGSSTARGRSSRRP